MYFSISTTHKRSCRKVVFLRVCHSLQRGYYVTSCLVPCSLWGQFASLAHYSIKNHFVILNSTYIGPSNHDCHPWEVREEAQKPLQQRLVGNHFRFFSKWRHFHLIRWTGQDQWCRKEVQFKGMWKHENVTTKFPLPRTCPDVRRFPNENIVHENQRDLSKSKSSIPVIFCVSLFSISFLSATQSTHKVYL